MSTKLVLLVALSLAIGAVAVAPTATAAHTCGDPGDEILGTIVYVCEGWHGGSCDGKYLNYGWYGICI